MPNRLKWLLIVVTAVAAALVVTAGSAYPLKADVGGLEGVVFWTLLTILAGAAPVRMPGGAVVSVTIAPLLACAVLGGPAAAAVAAVIGTTEWRELRGLAGRGGGIPWYGSVYNHASVTAPIVLAAIVHETLAPGSLQPSGASLSAVLLVGLIYFFGNNALTATAIGFREGRSPVALLMANIRQFGVSLVLQQIVRDIFTANNRPVETPQWMAGSLQINEALSITYNRLYVVLFMLIVFVLLQLVLKKTSLGLKVLLQREQDELAWRQQRIEQNRAALAALAAELTQLLDAQKLDSIAAQQNADHYVGALYFPGSQLLVIRGRYSSAARMKDLLSKKEYREVYLDLSSASEQQSRVFVMDLGADGLRFRRENDQPFDTADVAGQSHTFDGDWGRAKISEEAYRKTFAATDAQYAEMLQALVAALKKSS